jgi:diguanylate cyclase (GGDEF)-like protein
MTVGGLVVAPVPPRWWQFLLAVGVACAAHLLRQQIRVKLSVFYLAWGEAALIIALYLVPPGWVPLVIANGVLIPTTLRALWNRQPPPIPTPEVASCLIIAAGVGSLLSVAVAGTYQAPLSLPVIGALVLAGVGYFVVSTAGVHLLSARRQQVPVHILLLRTQRYKLPMSLSSIAVGLVAVAVANANWRWLVGLPVVLWLLHRSNTYRVRSGERRRMWAALAAATRSLNRPDESSVAAAGARGALEVFAVGRAAVTLEPANGSRRAWVADPTGQVRRLPKLPDDRAATVVPLLVGADEIGQLRVHFPEQAGPGDGEHAALQAYADALAAALHDSATHEELHRLLERSAHDAQHDPLTGLLNRSALLARGETVVQLVPHGAPVALLMIDVDHFREINDTLGHAAGDEVLAVTARRLRQQVRPGELIGRLGGDEFAMLVGGSPGASLETVQREAVVRGRALIQLLAEEAVINGVPVSIEASVAVVVAPAGTADMTELLRRVASAMHHAKQGGGTVGAYDAVQDAGSSDRPALLAELRQALDRDDELVLALQPVVELATGEPTGVEALARWRHPQRGLLPPAEFVRTVENSDLLGMFTEYVIDKALAAATTWSKQAPALPVAVNLSGRSLLDPRLPQAVAKLLRRHRLPGRRLIIEIAETVVTSELPGIEEALTNLRALGVRLSVDDFGTGYASLSFLTRIPLDEVKLDGKFVNRMAHSVEAAAIVRTTVELGRELGMRVVAEGVETAAQREQLLQLGCPAGQGYQLSPPTTGERIGEVLRELSAAAEQGELVRLGRRTRA